MQASMVVASDRTRWKGKSAGAFSGLQSTLKVAVQFAKAAAFLQPGRRGTKSCWSAMHRHGSEAGLSASGSYALSSMKSGTHLSGALTQQLLDPSRSNVRVHLQQFCRLRNSDRLCHDTVIDSPPCNKAASADLYYVITWLGMDAWACRTHNTFHALNSLLLRHCFIFFSSSFLRNVTVSDPSAIAADLRACIATARHMDHGSHPIP